MQSIPIHELSSGQYVYQDRGGTYSHPKPGTERWCENHTTVEEAVKCFERQVSDRERKR